MKVMFSLLVVLTFGYAAWEAFTYTYLARIFPLSISITFLIVAAINFWLEIKNRQKKQIRTAVKREDIRENLQNKV